MLNEAAAVGDKAARWRRHGAISAGCFCHVCLCHVGHTHRCHRSDEGASCVGTASSSVVHWRAKKFLATAMSDRTRQQYIDSERCQLAYTRRYPAEEALDVVAAAQTRDIDAPSSDSEA